MQFDRSQLVGQAILTDTPDGPVWKMVWKGVETDDYQVLKFDAADYPPGTVILIRSPAGN